MPESLVILAPGSFTDAQLSLLLGMLKALPASPLAVVDSALAACLEARRDTLFIDLQLHQCVVTLCRTEASSLGVADQEVLPDLGILPVYNAVAHGEHLIDGYRYDPLRLRHRTVHLRPDSAWLMGCAGTKSYRTPCSLTRDAALHLRREAVGTEPNRLGASIRLSHAKTVSCCRMGRASGHSRRGFGNQHLGTDRATETRITRTHRKLEAVRVRLRRDVPGAAAGQPPTRHASAVPRPGVPLSRPVSVRIANGLVVLLAGSISRFLRWC
jgi:hypothetical protein